MLELVHKMNPRLIPETHYATLSHHLVCTAAACAYSVAAIRCTNSNQFEFMRQIAATKFCRSDNDFHMSHEAICCSNLSRPHVTVICHMVCLRF